MTLEKNKQKIKDYIEKLQKDQDLNRQEYGKKHGVTYVDTIKLPIKEIWYDTREHGDMSFDRLAEIDLYPWKELRENIKNNGLKTTPKVVLVCGNLYNYEMVDGNHRMRILDDLYGGDHIIEVDLHLAGASVPDQISVKYLPLDVKERIKEINAKTYKNEE